MVLKSVKRKRNSKNNSVQKNAKGGSSSFTEHINS